MTNVSRPLLGLLVATVLFFGLWIVALKPSSSSTSPNGRGLGQYQSAINRAKASAASQDRAAAAANQTSATAAANHATATKSAAAAKPAAATKPATTAKSAASANRAATSKHTATSKPATTSKHATAATTHVATRHRAATSAKTASHARTAEAPTPRLTTTAERVSVVQRALADHQVLALLVYNPAASDDQAVRQELGTVPTRGGRVVKVAVPVREIADYPAVTNQVLITSSPTLVIIDSRRQAFTIVGFADQFEIAHRIDDALSVR